MRSVPVCCLVRRGLARLPARAAPAAGGLAARVTRWKLLTRTASTHHGKLCMIIIRHKVTGEPLLEVQGDTLAGAALGRAVLLYADLRQADLRGAFLRGADLCQADLRDAKLDGC